MERVRLIEAEWQEGADKEQFGEYHAEIKIFCHDRSGLLVDITKVFTEAEINISGIHSKTSKQGIATLMWPSRQKAGDRSQKLWKRSDRLRA